MKCCALSGYRLDSRFPNWSKKPVNVPSVPRFRAEKMGTVPSVPGFCPHFSQKTPEMGHHSSNYPGEVGRPARKNGERPVCPQVLPTPGFTQVLTPRFYEPSPIPSPSCVLQGAKRRSRTVCGQADGLAHAWSAQRHE